MPLPPAAEEAEADVGAAGEGEAGVAEGDGLRLLRLAAPAAPPGNFKIGKVPPFCSHTHMQ